MEINECKIPVLFENKVDCCGCGACLNICPKRAISMQEDEYGFLYPQIDKKLCVACGCCKLVCSFQNIEEEHTPLETYAAVSCDKEQRRNSASGGIFSAIASSVIAESGIVFGAAFEKDWSVRHIAVERFSDIYRIQGSKYAQSNIGDTYILAGQYLNRGKKVVYSGTPCQIAGLYGYLGKDYDNLMTVDVICHGVPNNRMLQEYIQLIGEKNRGTVTAFTFRDKSSGWGINGSVEIDGKRKKKIWQSSSSYFYYFLKGWIYRENCYKCKYACSHRPADITIGDYWGIEKVHPEYLGKSGWNEAEGISVIIANTQKGQDYLKNVDECIELKRSNFENAAADNNQLNHPCDSGMRIEILDDYFQGGWFALEKRFNHNIGWRRYSSKIKSLLPQSIKRVLKGMAKR